MRHTDVQESFQPRTRESIVAFVAFIERTRAVLDRNAVLPAAASPQAPADPDAAPPELPSAGHTAGITIGFLQQWANHWLDEIQYLPDLRRSEKDPETAENRVRNLKDLLADLDHDPKPTPAEGLEQFLEDLALDSDREDKNEKAGDAVILITMHSCKGLEFPQVYVVGLEEGLLPHARSKVEGTLDEERRLFYVAITRAMDQLTISHCAGRKKYGQIVQCHPSSFLKEIPAELTENANEKGKQPVPVTAGVDLFAAMRGAIE
jgi:superfamily I DNA/RNA helicase